MSVQRIESKATRTRGWQARAYVTKGHPRLTKLVSDSTAGGRRAAKREALAWEVELQRQAERIRRRLA